MKELAKTYDPKGIEERLYKKWEDERLLPCRSRPQQETIHDCDASTKHYRTASHGTRIRQYHAGIF